MEIPPSFALGGKRYFRRHRQRLPGMIVFLIICWTIGSIWLISVRRSERSMQELHAQQAAVAQLLPAEMLVDP
jgi:hypothetical protein